MPPILPRFSWQTESGALIKAAWSPCPRLRRLRPMSPYWPLAPVDKLGARGISTAEAGQTLWNGHVVIKNLRGSSERPQRDVRRLLIGRTDAGRILTLVIEETIEPTAWLLVTGWESTRAERMIMERS